MTGDQISVPLDVLVGIPDSDQVGQEGFTQITKFAQEFVKRFQIGGAKTRVGIFKYSGKPQTVLNLGQGISRRSVDDALQKLSFSGGSNRVDEALKYADTTFAAGGRTNVKRSLVLLMNGRLSAGSSDLNVVSQSLSGFDVVPVAIGSSARTETQKISKDYLYFESFPQLVSSGPVRVAAAVSIDAGKAVISFLFLFMIQFLSSPRRSYFDICVTKE